MNTLLNKSGNPGAELKSSWNGIIIFIRNPNCGTWMKWWTKDLPKLWGMRGGGREGEGGGGATRRNMPLFIIIILTYTPGLQETWSCGDFQFLSSSDTARKKDLWEKWPFQKKACRGPVVTPGANECRMFSRRRVKWGFGYEVTADNRERVMYELKMGSASAMLWNVLIPEVLFGPFHRRLPYLLETSYFPVFF